MPIAAPSDHPFDMMSFLIEPRNRHGEPLPAFAKESQPTSSPSMLRAWSRDWGGVLALALTAYARPEDRDRTLAAGYDQHLGKPIDPMDLASAVARLVRPS